MLTMKHTNYFPVLIVLIINKLMINTIKTLIVLRKL